MPTQMSDEERNFLKVFSKYGVGRGSGKSLQDMEWSELHGERKEIREALNKLLDEHPTSEKWNDQLEEAFNYGTNILKNLDREMDQRVQSGNKGPRGMVALGNLGTAPGASFGGDGLGGHGFPANSCREVWQDQDGKPVPVLGKEQKLSALPSQSGQIHNGVSLGAILQAMITGSKGSPDIQAALSEGSDAAGGFTVNDALSRQLIDRMRAKNRAIQAGAQTVLLNTEKTKIARILTDPAASWRSENTSVAESDMTFDQIQFVARSLAVLVPVSVELIEDSVNIRDALVNALAAGLSAEMDRVSLLGSGAAPEPLGLVNTVGVETVDMGADGDQLTSYDPLIDGMLKTADNNASEPTAAIMAPRSKFTLAKLKDNQGQPLRRPEAIVNLPFLDTKKIPTDETHGTATNASRIIMGDFSHLFLGIRSGLRIQVLRERYMDKLQYGFLAYLRMDVAVSQPGAFCMIEGIIP